MIAASARCEGGERTDRWSPHPKGGVSQQKGGSIVDDSCFMLAKLDMLAKLVYNQNDHGL